MIKISTNVLGTFALKNGRIIEKILFKGNVREIAEKLKKTENSLCDEEKALIKILKKSNIREVFVQNPRRFSDFDAEIKFLESDKPVDIIEIGTQLGFSREEILKLMREVQLELTKIKLKEGSWDRILVQAINTLDDLEDLSNLLMEHLKEWYSINFPELSNEVKNPEVYVKVILSPDKVDNSLKKKIAMLKKESFGMEFSNEDEKAVNSFARGVLELLKSKKEIEKYIKRVMKKNARNINALVGALLGARLISLAGSLEKLALMPSSTIQILGAEEAFFKFLKTKKRPPKHGIIFQLPEIRAANKKIRGKLSRTLAGKIAIAAKTDFYKGDFIGDKLREDFLKRVESLREK